MIKACVIQATGKSRLLAETSLGELFNSWMEEHPGVKIVHFFEPVRHDKLYGNYNENTYHTSLTFFYEDIPTTVTKRRKR